MTMPWFLPLGLLIGVTGTRTALRAHRLATQRSRDRTWWLLMALAWLPSFCWLMAQFIAQY